MEREKGPSLDVGGLLVWMISRGPGWDRVKYALKPLLVLQELNLGQNEGYPPESSFPSKTS